VAAQDGRLTEVSGEVYDMLGKPVVNASVLYRNVENGWTYRLVTDLNGKYHSLVFTGTYEIEITDQTGQPVYSGKKNVDWEGRQTLNVIRVDLSLVPTRSSLAPFKGPGANSTEGAAWRKLDEERIKGLTPEHAAKLRGENAAIATYIELGPQARAAMNAQDWPRAAELLDQLVGVAPYQWQLYQNLAVVMRSLDRNPEAVEALEKGIEFVRYDQDLAKDRQKLRSTLAGMMVLEGEAYSVSGRTGDAVTQFRRAAAIDPRPAVAYMRLCIAEYHNGEINRAVEACAAGIAADPKQPQYYQILAGIESNFGRYQDAIPVYEKGIRAAEKKLEATRISISIPARQYPGGAQTTTETVISEDTYDAKARAGQMLLAEGNAYFQLKKYRIAVGLFARAVGWHSYPALAYFNLCATQVNIGNLKAAVDACGQAIISDSSMADAYFVRASALAADAAKHGRVESVQAVVALKRYLELALDGVYSGDAHALLRELDHEN
jgi:tetratricopeptide (TPR) repeat protein